MKPLDDRTRDEIAESLPSLPALRSDRDRHGRLRWLYYRMAEGKPVLDPKGQPVAIDPRTMATPRAVQPGLDFARLTPVDYIPTEVRNRIIGRDKSGREIPCPHWELKHWERKYAIGFELNGGHHFDADDAWRVGQDPGGYFDLRRAAERLLARIDVDARLEELDGAERDEPGDDAGAAPVAAGPEPRKKRRGVPEAD